MLPHFIRSIALKKIHHAADETAVQQNSPVTLKILQEVATKYTPTRFKAKYFTIFTDMQNTPLVPDGAEQAVFQMQWDKDAVEMLEMVPDEFVAKAVRETEDYARENNYGQITIAVVNEYRKRSRRRERTAPADGRSRTAPTSTRRSSASGRGASSPSPSTPSSARCAGTSREAALAVFRRCDVEGAEADERPSYAALAGEFGLTVSQVTNHLHWARRELRREVLETLRETTASEEEFRAEARALLGVEAP